MNAHELINEYENLKDTRQAEAWKSFRDYVFRYPENYEDFIADLEILADESGVPASGEDDDNRARDVFEYLIAEPGDTLLAYEVLEIAVELEMDDYFGTEGLNI